MAEIGSGNGSSYPGSLDSDASLEVDSPSAGKTKARAAVVNDLASAIVSLQTELGTDPAGTLTNVKTFLQTEHETSGAHKDTKVVNVSGIQTITGSKTFTNLTASGFLTVSGTMSVSPDSTIIGGIYAMDFSTTRAQKTNDMYSLDSTNIDNLGFSLNVTASGSWSQANHICGVAQLTSGALNTGLSYVWPGINAAGASFTLSASEEARLKVYANTGQSGTTQKVVIIGWGDTNPGDLISTANQNGVFFRVHATGSVVNIFAVTKDGTAGAGNETTTDTGIADNSTFHTFEIAARSSEVRFYIDGNLVATHTDDIPTAGIALRTGIQTLENVAKTMRIDWLKESIPAERPT